MIGELLVRPVAVRSGKFLAEGFDEDVLEGVHYLSLLKMTV